MLRCFSLVTCAVLLISYLADEGQSQSAAKDREADPLPAGAITRLGQDRWLHGATAHFAAFVPDGKKVVTVNSDRTIRVWEFPSGRQIARFAVPGQGKSDPATMAKGLRNTRAALSSDGKTIAAWQGGTEIHLFDLAAAGLAPAKKPLQRRTIPVAKIADGPIKVQGLAFSPGNEELAIFSDGTVTQWDWKTAKEIRRFTVANSGDDFSQFRLAYSPDGKVIATGQLMGKPGRNDQVIVRLTDAVTGDTKRTIRIEADGKAIESSLAFSPDSKMLAIATGPSVTLADAVTGKEIDRLRVNKRVDPSGKVLKVEMEFLVFSKDSSRLYASDAFFAWGIMEWDVATRKFLRHSPPAIGSGEISISPDGKTLVRPGRGPLFFDLAAGPEIAFSNRVTAPLQSVRFLPDGKSVLTGTGVGMTTFLPFFVKEKGSVEKWDTATGKRLGSITSPPGTYNGIVSPDGRVVAGLQLPSKGIFGMGAKEPDSVILMGAGTGREASYITLQAPDNRAGICFAPDSSTIAVAQPKRQKIELYDVATAKLLRTLDVVPGGSKGPPKEIGPQQFVLFSADGKILACYEARHPPTLTFLDTQSGKPIGALSLLQAASNLQALGKPAKGMPGWRTIERAAFSPDGRCLALEIYDGTAAIYELSTGQPRRVFGQKQPPPKDDSPLAMSAALERARTCFAFSPDGRKLAQSGADGVVRLWDIVTGKELKSFAGHSEAVNAVAFAPDGNTLASASADGTALLWDVGKFKRLALPAKVLQPAELEDCWNALAQNDAAAAWAKSCELAASPMEALALIKDRVKPAAPLDMKRVQELLRQLDDQQFRVRDSATSELLRMGDHIVPALDQALAAKPPLETARRLQSLRSKLTGMTLHGERLRCYRAIEVLEMIGTPQARQMLQTLAAGAPGALLTTSARAALGR